MNNNITNGDVNRIAVVRQIADNILHYGRDCYAKSRGDLANSPMFADGLNINTKEHIKWKPPEGKAFAVSNLVNQQNLFRTLSALSNLTGNDQYKNAAVEAIKFHFDKFQDKSGLLQWGGHRVINLEKLQVNGNKSMKHELKNAFPYYELMYQVNPEKTVKFIKAFWNAHVFDWANLEISRHGSYGKEICLLWEHDFNNPDPFRETIGLSFLSAGNDLIYSAAMLYKLTGDKKALKWAKRLAKMYVKARNPRTNLGTYKYTKAMKRGETNDYSNTNSKYGDRAFRQLGPEFGKAALEGNMLSGGEPYSIYVMNALMELQLTDDIGEEVKEFAEWTLDGLNAYIDYAYMPEKNMFKPLITDGTDLSGYVLPRDGYYGKAGKVMKPFLTDSTYFYSFSRAFEFSDDLRYWEILRNIAIYYDLGDLGKSPGKKTKINFKTKCQQEILIFGLICIYRATAINDYLQLASIIADNIIENNYNKGFFVSTGSNIALFDTVKPLAILSLEAELRDEADKVANYIVGIGSKQSRKHYIK